MPKTRRILMEYSLHQQTHIYHLVIGMKKTIRKPTDYRQNSPRVMCTKPVQTAYTHRTRT